MKTASTIALLLSLCFGTGCATNTPQDPVEAACGGKCDDAQGIPQYELGHLELVATANAAAAEAGGIFLGGNSVAGVSFNQCIAHAEDLGKSVIDHLLALDAGTVQGV